MKTPKTFAPYLLYFILIGLLGLLYTATAHSQNYLNVSNCNTEEEVIALVDTVLLGNVLPIFKKNITVTGDPMAFGYFTSENVLGFVETSGIVMSSGFSSSLGSANNCIGFANGNTSGGSDPDLALAAGLSINDACVVEFDLMLFNDSVFLSYIFGSEEYHEWVSPLFADVFGFFLSGPGIDGPYSNDGINISLVPGTNEPVSIGTLNCGDQDVSCTPPNGNGPNCELLMDNTDPSESIFNHCVLDAFSVPLKTEQEIQSYEWYHFKLAIGDAGDAAYDSGVFLEKGSIVSIPVPTMNVVECVDEAEALQYIENTLLSNVSDENKANFSFSGDIRALGYFSETAFLKLDKSEGLLLTNGFAGNANGQNQCNTAADANTNNDGLDTDADLSELADHSNIGDVSFIEFDFRPTGDSISLQYVFASEEYHDMVNDGFNDVFGIFLSGPGIEGEFSGGAINIATIPGGDIPVNSSTINFGVGGETCDGKPEGCLNCEYLVDNSQKPDTAFFAMTYDGYTVPMQAGHQVSPGEWYHLKIAIADALPEDFDSGIFLPKGSLICDPLMTPVNERPKPENISLRPNPANDYVEIRNKGNETISSFAIYDINGRLLIDEPYKGNRISLAGLPKGVLFLELGFENHKSMYKLIHN